MSDLRITFMANTSDSGFPEGKFRFAVPFTGEKFYNVRQQRR